MYKEIFPSKLIFHCTLIRFVYWTDTNSAIGQGQVWRMRYDGSGKELVFDKLHSPHAITVDHASKKS